MMDLLAALILLGAPAAALFAIRCAIRRQFRRELDTGHTPLSWSVVRPVPRDVPAASSVRAP